jgi:hypothetical protein
MAEKPDQVQTGVIQTEFSDSVSSGSGDSIKSKQEQLLESLNRKIRGVGCINIEALESELTNKLYIFEERKELLEKLQDLWNLATTGSYESAYKAFSEFEIEELFSFGSMFKKFKMKEGLLKAAKEKRIICLNASNKRGYIFGIPSFHKEYNTEQEINDMFEFSLSVTNGIVSNSAVGGSCLDFSIKYIDSINLYKVSDNCIIDEKRNTVVSKYVIERGGRIC